MEFLRFGRLMVSRSLATTEQREQIRLGMARDLPTVTAEIDALVSQIADRVSRLPPSKLLQRAWWERSTLAIGLAGDDSSEMDQLVAMRMIDYVQSVIASVQPRPPYSSDVSSEEFAALYADVETLFARLNTDYQICLTSHRLTVEPNLDRELEEFRFRAETLWMNMRGERYHVHEIKALEDVIRPHSEILLSLFGVDSEDFVAGFARLLKKMTAGLHDALLELEGAQAETAERMKALTVTHPDTDLDTLRKLAVEDDDLSARLKQIFGELFGLDLFDVEKITGLPPALVDELAWLPGEEADFFGPGEFSGWPLRVWPTMKRPFIRIDGRVLAFDVFALFDNLYRIVQRLVFRLAPGYKDQWNQRQKVLSESLPIQYFQSILPGAQSTKSIFYLAESSGGKMEWTECDGVVTFEDHLFIIEVKAGAFTYTSPATDLPSHIASLKNLVQNPATQGKRFLKYLQSAPEVSLFDESHAEIGRLRLSDFRHITVCAVTLDPFTELAARGRNLSKVGIDVGPGAVWVLSVDDLRMFADLFDNPLVFLHFVEKRMSAAQSALVDVDDELDHLGLYLRENDYAEYVARLSGKGPGRVTFEGYRKAVDDYYSAVFRGESVRPPRQNMPDRLAEVVEFLGSSLVPGRAEATSFLLDGGASNRAAIAKGIDQQLLANRELKRPRPLSTHDDHAFTLFVWSPPVTRDAKLAREHALIVSAVFNEHGRPLLELQYSDQDVLVSVYWRHVDMTELSFTDVKRVIQLAEGMRAQRIRAAQKHGKLGPNEPCPCGSGKKYKRCCRV